MNGNNDTWFHDGNHNRETIFQPGVLRIMGVAALLLFLASHLPTALVAPALHKGLFLAALTSAVFALALREPPFAPEFSRWDEAASFYLLSMMAAAFIDTAAVTATLDELQAASGMEPRQTSVSEH